MRSSRWWPVAAAGLALALYVRTLAPGVFVADFAEFQYLPARLGLAHPNGFPFYMLLGKLWSLLPVGALAWRMNLLSALAGALAVGLTVAFVQRLSRRALPGLAAGALLALSPTFWLYSLAAERYTLNLALLIACIWAAWQAGEDAPRRRGERGGGEGEKKEERRAKEKADGPKRRGKESNSAHFLRAPRVSAVKMALLSAFFLALGLATHPSDALLLPFWLLFLWLAMPAHRWEPRFWLRLAGIGGAVQLLYLYAPWRWLAFSDWPLLPGIGRSSAVYAGLVHVWYAPGPRWELMAQYVLGLGGYAAGLAGGGWRAALLRAADLFPYWLADVPWPVTGAGLVGMLWLARRQWRLAGMLAGFAGLLFVMVAYIQQGKNDAYLLPAFWVAFVAAGMAVDGLLAAGSRLGAIVRPSATVVLGLGWVAAAGFLLIAGYPRLDHSRWNESQTWWDETLALPIESGAGLLGHWSDLTPFWYLQAAEGTRPDLVGLFPPDPEAVIRPWLEAGRALYLAAPLHGWAETLASDFRLTPWGSLTRIDLPGAPPRPCPLDGPALETSAGWPFAVSAWRLDAPISPADPPRLWLCWQARISLPRRTFLAITLAPAAGGPGLTLEAPLITPWYPQVQLGATSRGLGLLPFDLSLGRAPGVYRVTARPFYFREADGQTVYWSGVEPAALGSLRLPPQTGFRRLALDEETASPLPWRAGPLGLRAWRVSAQAVRPGDPVQVTTLWQVADVTDAPVALALRVRDGWGRLLEEERWPLPTAGLPQSALLRTEQILTAPRVLGDRRYWVEARLFVDREVVGWFPSGRLLLGRMHVVDREHVYSAPPGISRVEAEFGDLAHLLGYTVEPDGLRPGAPLAVTLYWQAQAEHGTSYKVFVHLVRPDGAIAAQDDAIPAGGALPTNLWVTGEVIADRHPLAAPDGLAPGRYSLRVGLYDPVSGERLDVVGGPAFDRALELRSFELP